MANMEWFQKYGNTSVEFIDGVVSDHSPAVIVIDHFISFGPKPIKFFNFWADHSLFLDWVKEGWSYYVEGYPMYQLYVMLKAVKRVLKIKNKEVFGELGQKVLQAWEKKQALVELYAFLPKDTALLLQQESPNSL
jgi:hypothetical protein